MGETSRNQNCLNFMGASNIPIIIGQMPLQLWGTVVGLWSLLRGQTSWEQKLAAWTYRSLFPLTTDLLKTKWTIAIAWMYGGVYPVEFKSTLFTRDFWLTISHIGETRSGSTCTTELNESQDDSGRCLIKVSWRKLFSYSGYCWADREPEQETDREFAI